MPLDNLESGELPAMVKAYNRCLTRRMSKCQIEFRKDDNKISTMMEGTVIFHFKFLNPVYVKNKICVNDKEEEFVTKFNFSKKSVLAISITNKDTAKDVINRLKDMFQIEAKCEIFLYERELSSCLPQVVYFRRILDEEEVLAERLVSRLRREKKSFVFMDHDPNEVLNCNEEKELQNRLDRLHKEEEQAIKKLSEKILKIKEYYNDPSNFQNFNKD